MGNSLFKDTPIPPISLNTVTHYDLSLNGKLNIQIQFDPLTSDGDGGDNLRLYYRVDETAAAPSALLSTFGAEGYLTAGGDVEIHIDPALNETPFLHVLLWTAANAVGTGGANDRVLITAYRANPD
jgi:hypothetical protein